MQKKPEIIFTFPACMGGVASFNFNIINFSRLISKFHSKVILIKAKEDNLPPFLENFAADEVLTFEFSYKENQYHAQKRLNLLLGNNPGCIVTDNGLTVYAAKRFNNPKTVYHLLHDYYYVTEAVIFGDMIDVAIAHSSFFSDAVFANNPPLFSKRTFYIPYGVQQLEKFPQKNNDRLKLVFLGRLDDSKGVELLYEIEQGLTEKKIQVDWTIIGKGTLKQSLVEQWRAKKNILFFEPDSTAEVYKILAGQDIFVFPTSFEGTPVSILEALANGIVTITNDLPGGIRDIVLEGIGFRCALNDVDEYIDKIVLLHENRGLLNKMQLNCYELSGKSYDIRNNADNYFEKFLQYDSFKRSMKQTPIRLSRLDNPIFPNALVKMIRNLK